MDKDQIKGLIRDALEERAHAAMMLSAHRNGGDVAWEAVNAQYDKASAAEQRMYEALGL